MHQVTRVAGVLLLYLRDCRLPAPHVSVESNKLAGACIALDWLLPHEATLYDVEVSVYTNKLLVRHKPFKEKNMECKYFFIREEYSTDALVDATAYIQQLLYAAS